MNGADLNITAIVQMIFTSYVSIFVIAVAATIFSLKLLTQLPAEIKKYGIIKIILLGIVNGLIVVFYLSEIEVLGPIWMLLGFPLVIVWEFSFLSEDTRSCYYRIYIRSLLDFSCIYWLVTNGIGLVSVRYMNQAMALSLTLLAMSMWSYYLTKSKRFSVKKFKMLIHEKVAGKLFFKYIVFCNVFLVFLTWNYKVFSFQGAVDFQLQRMMCGEMLLKTAFIWWSSRILFEMVENQISYVKNEIYTENILDKERAFRNTIMKKGILSFNINITTDEIKEGREYLNPQMWKEANSFFKMISEMNEWGIHPEDREEFTLSNSKGIITERVECIPYYSHQVRVSPKEMIRYFNLSEEIKDRYRNTEKDWVWLKLDYIYTKDRRSGEIYVFIAIFDVDLQVEQGEKLRKSATTDFLTGVLNRATIEKKVNEKMEKKKGVGAFILIDIDNFKNVNDVLGHPKGDELLKKIAEILKDSFRKDDFVGRLGGDEFCVFLQNITDLDVVEDRARKLNERCRIECYGEQGELVKVSASLGIAVCNELVDDYKKLYKYADLALYETKKRGKDDYTIYTKGH